MTVTNEIIAHGLPCKPSHLLPPFFCKAAAKIGVFCETRNCCTKALGIHQQCVFTVDGHVMKRRAIPVGDHRLAGQPCFQQHDAEAFATAHVAQRHAGKERTTDHVARLTPQIDRVWTVDRNTVVIRANQHGLQVHTFPVELFHGIDDLPIALCPCLPAQDEDEGPR